LKPKMLVPVHTEAAESCFNGDFFSRFIQHGRYGSSEGR
jgi:hypothetical protein